MTYFNLHLNYQIHDNSSCFIFVFQRKHPYHMRKLVSYRKSKFITAEGNEPFFLTITGKCEVTHTIHMPPHHDIMSFVLWVLVLVNRVSSDVTELTLIAILSFELTKIPTGVFW